MLRQHLTKFIFSSRNLRYMLIVFESESDIIDIHSKTYHTFSFLLAILPNYPDNLNYIFEEKSIEIECDFLSKEEYVILFTGISLKKTVAGKETLFLKTEIAKDIERGGTMIRYDSYIVVTDYENTEKERDFI